LIFFVGNELQEMARAASGYHKVLAENRALYNEVQDLKGVSGFC
jgi:kinesin family protein C2/C3